MLCREVKLISLRNTVISIMCDLENSTAKIYILSYETGVKTDFRPFTASRLIPVFSPQPKTWRKMQKLRPFPIIEVVHL